MEVVNPQHLPFELTKEFIEDIRLMIENQANEEILLKLDELFPADITSILIELTTEEAKYLVLLIDTKLAAEIISTLDADDRKKFLKNFITYYRLVDKDNNGIIDEVIFSYKSVCFELQKYLSIQIFPSYKTYSKLAFI